MLTYAYVGPADLPAGPPGHAVPTPAAFARWASRADLSEPFTYVVTLDGTLRLAPRRSEHVACASGERVLAAGEILFVRSEPGWTAPEVTNQSTGYCPAPSCWPAVAAALTRAGLNHPGHFTTEFIFRHCATCGELTVVKDDDYYCYNCETPLPA
ncbi:hypothetical protein GCM10010435_91300 [Winogradskya consettensis]|uniref:Uncharacterized protein n=1 Tax=Winogradskya consettensis TaxID=113560 RepID=A0A919VRP6_9ACTN|nr:hypothetical protein [Actinoplanes consettensis]GIM73362.1 hypothetical protein Aco04nite_34870 [Actinoplanes consettensis]